MLMNVIIKFSRCIYSVVTSVSVIMDHGNGTKTFLTDGVENPELKTNVIASPGNLLSPDRYEFYTFDETGDLVKRLMTWDEIQALIAGGDSNAFLGDASVPMYYSDGIPDKLGSTHLTANDFQTSDIQGVHKVVESVQNVLKSELAASQSKIPPVAKPGLMSNSLNWSLFLPTLLDNAEEGSEINNLGVLISPSALSSSTDRNVLKDSISMQTNATQTAATEVQNVTESEKSTTLDTTFSTFKEFSKKTEKPSRYKPTTNKPVVPVKTTFNSPVKSSLRPTTEKHWSTVTSSTPKKQFSTSKYGGYLSSDTHWSTVSSNPKKPLTSIKYGMYGTNEDSVWSTNSPFRKNLTTKYGSYSSLGNTFSVTTEVPSTKISSTTSKYEGQSTNNELFQSIASVLQQVTDDSKTTSALLLNNTNVSDKTSSTLQYKIPTESSQRTSTERIVSMNQFKGTTDTNKFTMSTGYKTGTFNRRPSTEFEQSTTENYKIYSSTEKKYLHTSRYTTPENQMSSTPYKFAEMNKFTMETSGFQQKVSSESNKYTTSDKTGSSFLDKFKTPVSTNTQKTIYTPSDVHKTGSLFSDIQKISSPFSNGHRPFTSSPDIHRSGTPSTNTKNSMTDTQKTVSVPSASESYRPVSLVSDNHKTMSPPLDSHKTVSSFSESYKPASLYSASEKTISPILTNDKTVQSSSESQNSVSVYLENHKTTFPPLDNHKITASFTENYKPVVLSSDSHRTAPPFSDNLKTVSSFPDFQKTVSTFSDSRKTASPFQQKSTTESNKYTFTDNRKVVSTTLFRPSAAMINSTKKPADNKNTASSTPKIENSSFKLNSSHEYTEPQASYSNNLSVTTNYKDTSKSTKTYQSSTPFSTGYVTLQRQPLTTKPNRNKVTSTTKFSSSKPFETTNIFSSSANRPQESLSETTNEKPLIRISTSPTFSEQTTTRFEPLVTWISTSPLEDAPNKVSLFGVYESDKLVTEQYVSSSNDRHSSVVDLFRNTSSSTFPKESTSTSVSLEDNFMDANNIIKHTTKVSSTELLNNFSTGYTKNSLSHSFESSRPFRTSERPDIIEFKTEPMYQGISKSSTNYFTSSDSNDKYRTTNKPSTLHMFGYNYSSAETVMQRVPTINPPNKSNSNTGVKASTKPQHLFTDAMKNITQIAVMLNKLNETTTKNSVKNEFRNKITSKPIFDTTKPINALLINDCITSLISNSVKENYTGESVTTNHPHIHYSKLPTSDQKENSNIYYYKLPPIIPQDSHIHFYKPTEENFAPSDVQYYKPEIVDPNVKSTTEKEYHKITTVNRPADFLQESISAATNILLQTESRVPNKELGEFEATNTTRSQTTENILFTEELELNTKNFTTKNFTEETTTQSMTGYKTAENLTDVQNSISTASMKIDNTTEFIELTSVDYNSEKHSNDTDGSMTEIGTTDSDESAIVTTTLISPDFRNEYVIDDRNITQEEEEDIKNYHPYPTANRTTTIANIKSTSSYTPMYTEVIKLKSTTATAVVKSTERSPVKFSTEKADDKMSQNNINRNTAPTRNTSNTEFVEVKLENKTTVSSKTDAPGTSSPTSAYHSPSNPAHRLSTSTASPGVELHPAPHESMGLEASIAYLGDDIKRFVDLCNELSFKIWTTQTSKNMMTSRSIVLSPFAVLSALAMIFLGARGSSSGIMNDFLKLDDMVTFNPHQVLQNITESSIYPKNIGVANAALVRAVFSDKVILYVTCSNF